jgi:hypothetical protein
MSTTTTAPDYAAHVQGFLDACTTADAMLRTATDMNKKALVAWAQGQGLAGNPARMQKPELAELVAATAWAMRPQAERKAPEAPEAPELPEAPEAPTDLIAAWKAEKGTKAAKAPKGDKAPRTKVELGQLPEGADEGTCRSCGATKAATKFPKAVVAGKRQPNLRADECRECRDLRRQGGTPAPVVTVELPAEGGPELSAAEATELAEADATNVVPLRP